jgi:hypothetical protein
MRKENAGLKAKIIATELRLQEAVSPSADRRPCRSTIRDTIWAFPTPPLTSRPAGVGMIKRKPSLPN